MTIPAPLPELSLSDDSFDVMHWLSSWRDQEDFELNAPYQRGSVWTIDQRRNLIKSLLMGLPVGKVVVAEQPWKNIETPSFRIVDGKQRIEAVRAFFKDEFSVPGWWFDPADLEDPSKREGDVVASDLSQRGRRGMESAKMGSLTFKPETEVTPNPNYDDSLIDKYHKPIPGHEDDPNIKRYLFRKRTPEEILQAEAELYLLVNFGGVAQTDEDRARAEEVAR